jgi:uncharacterized membrane protein
MKISNNFKLFSFCVALLIIRILKTDHYSFIFLLWNLFLAWVPYGIIKNYHKLRTQKAQGIAIGLTLLFLPNAPYIITDLFHLTKNLVAPMWFDLILILSFSLLGLILFIATTEKLLKILAPFFKSQRVFSGIKFLILLSNGYGMYLGRYLRFNSWDILSNPDDLVIKIYQSVFNSHNYKETLAVTITFTIFLTLIYEIYTSFKERVGGNQNELS